MTDGIIFDFRLFPSFDVVERLHDDAYTQRNNLAHLLIQQVLLVAFISYCDFHYFSYCRLPELSSTMTSDPNVLLAELNANLQVGDVDGGMITLSKIKVCLFSPNESARNAFYNLNQNIFFYLSQVALLELDGTSELHASLATSALELGVLLTVAAGDLDAFARNLAQLKPYYSKGIVSERKNHILGLNLMFFLVENRLSEFHAELELLTEVEASDIFVSFPIQLERQLMVGSYDEVLNATARIPDASYEFFMDNLLQTVRDSIADCIEVSYKTLKVQDAMIMMKFDTSDQMRVYIEECRDDWLIDDDLLCFQPPVVGSKASDIPSMKLITQSLTYATELERIV